MNSSLNFVYFYGEGAHTLNCGQCHLKLGDAERAADYAQRSLAALDPSFTRLVAFTSVNLGRAYVQSGEIDDAARLLGDAGEIAAYNSSARLIERLRQARADLLPWATPQPSERSTTAWRLAVWREGVVSPWPVWSSAYSKA